MATSISQSPRTHLVTLLVCFAVATLAVVLSVDRFPEISGRGEAEQLHYTHELGRGELVGPGEAFSVTILEELGARGFRPDPELCVDCRPSDTDLDRQFDPPIYHAVGAVGAAVIRTVSPVESYTTAARSVGVLWLTAGMFLCWLLCLELGVRAFTSRVLAVALGLIPAVVDVSATVNNDAASLVAGSAVAITAVRHVRGRGSVWLVLAACSIAALLDPLFVCSAALASLLLLVHARHERKHRRAWGTTAATALALPLVFVVVVVGWDAVSPGRAAEPDAAVRPAIDEFSDDEGSGDSALGDEALEDEPPSNGLVADAASMLPVTQTPRPVPQARSPLVQPWLDLTNLMIAGAPFCVWLLARSDDETATFAGVVVWSMAVGALSIVALNHLRTGTMATSVGPRDGLALLPAAVACSALLVDRSRTGRAAAAVVVAVAGVLLFGEIGGVW